MSKLFALLVATAVLAATASLAEAGNCNAFFGAQQVQAVQVGGYGAQFVQPQFVQRQVVPVQQFVQPVRVQRFAQPVIQQRVVRPVVVRRGVFGFGRVVVGF